MNKEQNEALTLANTLTRVSRTLDILYDFNVTLSMLIIGIVLHQGYEFAVFGGVKYSLGLEILLLIALHLATIWSHKHLLRINGHVVSNIFERSDANEDVRKLMDNTEEALTKVVKGAPEPEKENLATLANGAAIGLLVIPFVFLVEPGKVGGFLFAGINIVFGIVWLKAFIRAKQLIAERKAMALIAIVRRNGNENAFVA